MNIENVFPISTIGGGGNCFVDERRFVNAPAHVFDLIPQNYNIAIRHTYGEVYVAKHRIYRLQFKFKSTVDYAIYTGYDLSDVPIPIVPFATRLPGNGKFTITITSAYPDKFENRATARIREEPHEGFALVKRIVFEARNIVRFGESGSVVVWEQPGVFGTFFQNKTEPRILGMHVANDLLNSFGGIAEICPQVYGM